MVILLYIPEVQGGGVDFATCPEPRTETPLNNANQLPQRQGITLIGIWCNGSTTVLGTVDVCSIQTVPAKF